MLPWIAGLIALTSARVADEQRMDLPNGATAFVKAMERQQLVSIQLFASSRTAPETAQTNGYRHLLEHVLARGTGKVDFEVERVGGLIRARTTRDWIQIQIDVPPENLEVGLSALKQILSKKVFEEGMIRQEVSAIRIERALEDPSVALANAGWTSVYGERGLDAVGNNDIMSKATPEDLRSTYDSTFVGNNLVCVVAGEVNAEKTVRSLATILSAAPRSKSLPVPDRIVGMPRKVNVPEASGEARCVGVAAFDELDAAATVAAGLAFASTIENGFFIYTPTQDKGLVSIGRAGSSVNWAEIDGWQRQDFLKRYNTARNLARQWYRSQIASPAGLALLAGSLLSQDRDTSPARFSEQIEAVDPEAFVRAMTKFQASSATQVVGGK